MTEDELKRLVETFQQQSAAAGEQTRRYFDETVERLAAVNRRHFDVSVEATKHELRLVAETVVHFGERLERLGEKMDRGFADTQAMIKLSHAE